MQLHRPDPELYAGERERANFRLAVQLSAGFVALLWLIHWLDWGLGLGLQDWGIRPRSFGGLSGILFAPLLHGGFVHLISNSLPLLVLGTGLLYLYPSAAFKVVAGVYLGAGLLVWLFARPSLHIGSSGLVYGLAVYLFVAGLIRRDARAIAAALLVYILYGTLIWGVLPIRPGVSWETHLAAAVIAVLLAVSFRHSDIAPRQRYDWEDEDE